MPGRPVGAGLNAALFCLVLSPAGFAAPPLGLENSRVTIDGIKRIYGLGYFGAYTLGGGPDNVAVQVTATIAPPPTADRLPLEQIRVKTADGATTRATVCGNHVATELRTLRRGTDAVIVEPCFGLPRGARLSELMIGPVTVAAAEPPPGSHQGHRLRVRSAAMHRSVREPELGGFVEIKAPEGKRIYQILFDVEPLPGTPRRNFLFSGEAELVTRSGDHLPPAGTGILGQVMPWAKFSPRAPQGTLPVRFLLAETDVPVAIWVGASSFDLTVLPAPGLPSVSPSRPRPRPSASRQ
jgi:hypothetical protein